MSTSVRSTQINLDLYVIAYLRDGILYVESPQWELVLDGETLEEALELLKDAVSGMAAQMFREGTLGSYLSERGYSESRLSGQSGAVLILTYALRGKVSGSELPAKHQHASAAEQGAYFLSLSINPEEE